MRVCLSYIRWAALGGIEKFLLTHAAALAARGHRVTVLCREKEGTAPPGVHIRRLGGLALGSGAKVRAFAQAVERHLDREQYDVVLGLGKTWSQDVLRLGGGLHQVFLEQTREPGDPLRKLDKVSLEIEERAFRAPWLRRVIANSEMVKREMLQHFALPAKRITVIYNGVDSQRYDRQAHAHAAEALRQQLGWGPREVVFLFLGNGFHRKGLGETLEAFADVCTVSPHVRLLVVGADADSERSRYREQVRRLKLESRTAFLGERRDAPVCYTAADIYVLPTRYDPFANATLEALASGLPVITSDCNGGAEILTDGLNGSVVPRIGGAEALSEALRGWSDLERVRASRTAARAAALCHPLESKLDAVEVLLKEVRSEKVRA